MLFPLCMDYVESIPNSKGNKSQTHFNVTQPAPTAGAVQKTWILVRLRGVLSVTAGGQSVINCVSPSSMI